MIMQYWFMLRAIYVIGTFFFEKGKKHLTNYAVNSENGVQVVRLLQIGDGNSLLPG